MAAVIGFLLKQKQSTYQIGINHRELGISEKTLYKHIENAVFHETARITVLNLRRRYSEKFPKTDKRNIKGGATENTYKVGSTRTIRITYKTVLAMTNGGDQLKPILDLALFCRYVHVLLTDKGTNFSLAEAMENSSDGTRRTRVYYCNPMQSGQKGILENR